jgi:ribose transport system substrate-binding protein
VKKLLIWVTIVVFAVSIIFLGLGCKKEAAETTAAETTAAETTAAETTAAETTAAETTAAKEYKITFYFPNIHPYYEAVTKGLVKFEEDFGIHIDYLYGNGWTQDISISNIESLVSQGYKGICDGPFDANACNLLYEEIVKQGVFVTTFGSVPNTPTPASFGFATDIKGAAMQAAEIVIEKMGKKGHILNVLEVMEDPNTRLRKEGVEEVVAKYPDVEIIQEVAGMSTIEESLEKVGAALSANVEEIDGIITTGYTPSVAVATLLTEMNNDRIAFCGIDDDPDLLKAIKDGYASATIAQNPYGQGYLGSLSLKLLLDGYKTKDPYAYVNSDLVVVTKENADTYIDDLWNVTLGIADKFADTYLVAPES